MVNSRIDNPVGTDAMGDIADAIESQDAKLLEKAIKKHPSNKCWETDCKCETAEADAGAFYTLVSKLDNLKLSWLAHQQELLSEALREPVDLIVRERI